MNVLAAVLAVMALIVPQETKVIRWASPTQGAGFTFGPFPQCLSGGWGAGKTWLGCQRALYLSTTYRKNRGVIARVVGKDLRATTMATFFKVVPPRLYSKKLGGRRNDNEGYVKLIPPYESEILFLHLEDPETLGIIRGLEINWFLIDQAEENADKLEEIFDLLLGRLGRWDLAEVPQYMLDRHIAETGGQPWPYIHPESGKPVPPPYPMVACNPDVEVHWLYRRFHPDSQEHQELYKSQGYTMFHMPSDENQFLGETNRRFLYAHDEAFIRRNVRGEWGMPEGAIHTVNALSVIPGSPELLEYLRARCLLYRTLDHGDSAPTCVLWWAVDNNGNAFCLREYYLPNALISTHRGNVAGLSEGEVYEQNLADPSIFHQMPQKQGGRWSVADEWGDVNDQPRHTAVFWTAADNNELGTRNRLNEFLRVDPERKHPFDQAFGAPRLFFLKQSENYPQGCYHVLRELRSQRRVRVGTDLGKPVFSDERDPDLPDHAYDNVRYFIASRPGVPTIQQTGPDGSFFSKRRELARAQRKRFGGRR